MKDLENERPGDSSSERMKDLERLCGDGRGERLFNTVDPSSTEADGGGSSIHPLKDYVFCSQITTLDSQIEGTSHNLKTLVASNGGKMYKTFVAKCNALLLETLDESNKTVKRAIDLEIPIVDANKLIKGLLDGDIKDISTCCFSGFEGEDYVKRRRGIHLLKRSSKSERAPGQSSSKRAKVTVQNGAEVFTETGLSGNKGVQVYKDFSGVVYAATLGLVNIAAGKNSYYKLQVLQRGATRFDLFRAWGRIGTDIGGNTFDTFFSANGAVDLFRHHYQDKTANEWGEPFVKQPGRMYRLDLDYGPTEEDDVGVKPGALTTLDKSIQALVNLIFDINTMKDTLLEFEIDLNKMPLGKLSSKQIREAFGLLRDSHELLDDLENNKIKILDLSTRFYTLIPHDFGMTSPPILDTVKLITKKTKMLETLLELELAYSMTKRGIIDKGKDPIDVHYMKLNSNISVLPRDSKEFEMLEEYVSSTHGSTHTMYTLHIENVFKVERNGEEDRYSPYKDLHNRMLLWHGSRTSNYAGILSQGLRIAPPEAPVTGYMFGKGLYFADMVTKSANYCCPAPGNKTGLLLLCEVALGDMYCLKGAQYVEKLPRGFHSTKGLGRTAPASSTTLPSGCVVPRGPGVGVSEAGDSELLYNEYIVYNVNQVQVKYLFEMKFSYHGR